MRHFLYVFVIAAFSAYSGCSKTPQYPAPVTNEKGVIIDIGHLRDGIPSFFSIRMDGKRINFFVIWISDNVEAYFDACEKCYGDKMGYRIEGSSVVCGSCRISYPIDKLKEGIGSCRPVPITGRMVDKHYIIPFVQIKEGVKYF